MIGWLAALGCGVVAVFQLALAAGAPFGRAAWGGTQAGRLPARLRVASLIAVPVWTFAALLVVRRAGHLAGLVPHGAAVWGVWVLTGLFALSALLNAASRSRLERAIWAPFGVVMAVLCFLVARG